MFTHHAPLTSLGMCPWYQPWLLMSAALSFSSSSSSLRSFSGGDSSRYFSLENWQREKTTTSSSSAGGGSWSSNSASRHQTPVFSCNFSLFRRISQTASSCCKDGRVCRKHTQKLLSQQTLCFSGPHKTITMRQHERARFLSLFSLLVAQ